MNRQVEGPNDLLTEQEEEKDIESERRWDGESEGPNDLSWRSGGRG